MLWLATREAGAVGPHSGPQGPVRPGCVGGHIISVGTRGFLSDCLVAEMTGDQLDSGNSCRVATASGRGREGQGGPSRSARGGPRDTNDEHPRSPYLKSPLPIVSTLTLRHR